MSENLKDLSGELFDEALREHPLVLVDFWATWCIPCQMLMPLIEEIADGFQSRALVGKVDIDNSKEIADRYAVRSIPTLLLFSNGKEVARYTGLLNKTRLANLINQHL